MGVTIGCVVTNIVLTIFSIIQQGRPSLLHQIAHEHSIIKLGNYVCCQMTSPVYTGDFDYFDLLIHNSQYPYSKKMST